jgi:transposase
MAKKRYRPEEIVTKPRQVEVLQSQGMAVADAIRRIDVSEVTCYRWRQGIPWDVQSSTEATQES